MNVQRLNRFEAAKYMGVSVVTVDRLLAGGSLRHYKIGRRVIFSSEHLDEYLRVCERHPVCAEFPPRDQR